MVRSALSANRTLAILDWVVGHPGEKFTLSELSRASGINIPSLMAVLQSLTDAGYLSRSPVRKTYEAGPALLAIGLSVGAHNRAFQILPHELEQLAQAVGVECSATVAIGEQTMTVADAGRPGSYSLPMRVGGRFPLMAPVGHVFLAWSEPAEVEAWIARSEGPGFTIDRARIERELALVRQNGYSLLHYAKAGYQPSEALELLAAKPDDPRRREMVRSAIAAFAEGWEFVEPEPGRRYDVSNVVAPVFNAQGKVLMAIVLNGFAQIEGSELLGHVERLLQTTRLLTKHGNGMMPKPA
jgi:DNA-binding IclR family transcriptional regulator